LGFADPGEDLFFVFGGGLVVEGGGGFVADAGAALFEAEMDDVEEGVEDRLAVFGVIEVLEAFGEGLAAFDDDRIEVAGLVVTEGVVVIENGLEDAAVDGGGADGVFEAFGRAGDLAELGGDLAGVAPVAFALVEDGVGLGFEGFGGEGFAFPGERVD
jgi:hypothetical protein